MNKNEKLHCEIVLLHKDTLKEIFDVYNNFEDVPTFVEVVAWPKVGNPDTIKVIKK